MSDNTLNLGIQRESNKENLSSKVKDSVKSKFEGGGEEDRLNPRTRNATQELVGASRRRLPSEKDVTIMSGEREQREAIREDTTLVP